MATPSASGNIGTSLDAYYKAVNSPGPGSSGSTGTGTGLFGDGAADPNANSGPFGTGTAGNGILPWSGVGTGTNAYQATPKAAAAYQQATQYNMTQGAGALANPNAGNSAAMNAMTPQQQLDVAEQPSNEAKGSGFNSFLQTWAPIAFEAVLDAETAGTVGSLLGGGLAGATAGGAAAGLENTALQAAQSQKGAGTGANVTWAGAAKNVGLSALSGAANFEAAGLTGDLSSLTGLSPTASGALVRGGVGVGMGTVTDLLNGTGAGKGAPAGAAAVSPLLSSGSSSGTNATSYLGAGAAAGVGATVSGQGNNDNMASTDTSLASTIIGSAGSLLQAGVGSAGSLAAANAETNADQNAITTQKNNLGNINSIWSKQQGVGQGADTTLSSSLGLNGQTANYSNFENMPGYQFAVQQGTQAIQRQAAAMGNAYTPNTAAAVGQYVTGTASQDYNTYISQLMGAAGLGTTANQGLQTGSQQSSNNISQLQQNIGTAQGQGYTGVANSVGSLFGVNGAGTGLVNSALNGNSSGVSPMNYGGQNPNGTTGNGTSSDPYGANANQYNQSNGVTSSDISNSTSGSTTGDNAITFDPNSVSAPSPVSIDTGDMGDDFSDDATGFLGDW